MTVTHSDTMASRRQHLNSTSLDFGQVFWMVGCVSVMQVEGYKNVGLGMQVSTNLEAPSIFQGICLGKPWRIWPGLAPWSTESFEFTEFTLVHQSIHLLHICASLYVRKTPSRSGHCSIFHRAGFWFFVILQHSSKGLQCHLSWGWKACIIWHTPTAKAATTGGLDPPGPLLPVGLQIKSLGAATDDHRKEAQCTKLWPLEMENTTCKIIQSGVALALQV